MKSIKLSTAILAILTVIAITVAICAIRELFSPYPQHDSMAERANAVAKCKSLGGVYGDTGCYVNGVLKK